MSQFQKQIAKFNKSIRTQEISIIDYCKELQQRFYPTVDISFMETLLDYVTRDEICIPGQLLFDYKIVGVSSNRINQSKRIKDLLSNKSYKDLLENLHYNRKENLSVRENRGEVANIVYHFHPRAFKLILMRSRNRPEFAQYYIYLEECIYYYNQYQLLKQKYANKTLRQLLNEINIKLDESHNQHEETSRELSAKLDESHKQHEETRRELSAKLDESHKLQQETFIKLSQLQQDYAIQSLKLQQYQKIAQNNHRELLQATNTLQSASQTLQQTSQTLQKPTSIQVPSKKPLIDTLIIYNISNTNQYIYACRQQRGIKAFQKKHIDKVLINLYSNINNSKYCVEFLKQNNIIISNKTRLFTSQLQPQYLKIKLDELIPKFISITSADNIEHINQLIQDTSRELQISTEDNTLFD